MENGKAIQDAREQKRILGYSTLLFAFTEAARKGLEAKGLDQEEVAERLREILRFADAEPAYFLVRVTQASAWDGARLYRDEAHPHGYRWAKELIEEVDEESGVDLQREDADGSGRAFLKLYTGDLVAAYVWLRTRYPDPADWRNFLRQAKALLLNRYPGL